MKTLATSALLVSPVLKILTMQCGACHVPTSPFANRKALAVFDLSAPGWLEQIKKHASSVNRRLAERVRMKPSELKELAPRGANAPRAPTEKEVAMVRLELLP